MEFLENPPAIWREDHAGTLVVKDKVLDASNTNEYIEAIGYNTRVVAFWYDKEEWKEEIQILKKAACHNAARMNLRVGQVTDP